MSNQQNAGNGDSVRIEIAKVREYIEKLKAVEYEPNLLVQCWPETLLCVSPAGTVTGIADADKRTAEGWRGADLYTNGQNETAKLARAEHIRRETIAQTEATLALFEQALNAAQN